MKLQSISYFQVKLNNLFDNHTSSQRSRLICHLESIDHLESLDRKKRSERKRFPLVNWF